MIFKTKTGQVADGDAYYHREYLDAQFWKYISHGAHVLISAPRRVGKSSFLNHIAQQGRKGYIIKYHDTESINNSNDFFKRLYKSLLEELSQKDQLWQKLTTLIQRNKIEKIGSGGIEIKGSNLDYYNEFRHLITEMETDHTFIFILDEFSETTENIIQDAGEKEALLFLNQNRELRQNMSIRNKIQFVYCGSIGLANITERIYASKTINDLTDLNIPPFSNEEALALIRQVLINKEIEFKQESMEYLLDKISWLMPFYIQIILDELDTILIKNLRPVSRELIDQAFEQSINKRLYFDHWHTRLRTVYKGNEFNFIKAILNKASTSTEGIALVDIYDLAVRYETEAVYMSLLKSLVYDGYLHADTKRVYTFNSPLLLQWWKNNIAF